MTITVELSHQTLVNEMILDHIKLFKQLSVYYKINIYCTTLYKNNSTAFPK
jgi:hypothetical protein